MCKSSFIIVGAWFPRPSLFFYGHDSFYHRRGVVATPASVFLNQNLRSSLAGEVSEPRRSAICKHFMEKLRKSY